MTDGDVAEALHELQRQVPLIATRAKEMQDPRIGLDIRLFQEMEGLALSLAALARIIADEIRRRERSF